VDDQYTEGRTMERTEFVTRVLMAGLYAVPGVLKLTAHPVAVGSARRLHIPWNRYRLIGALEFAGAVGVVLGLRLPVVGTAAVVGLTVLIIGALVYRVRYRESLAWILLDAGYVTATVVAAIVLLAPR